jgi:hypothetical protein
MPQSRLLVNDGCSRIRDNRSGTVCDVRNNLALIQLRENRRSAEGERYGSEPVHGPEYNNSKLNVV